MPLARLPPLLLPNLPRPPPPPLSIAPTWIQIPLLLRFNLLRRLSLSLCVRFFPRFFVSLSVITYMEGGGKVFQTRSKRVSAMHRELMRKTSYFTVAWTTLSLSASLSFDSSRRLLVRMGKREIVFQTGRSSWNNFQEASCENFKVLGRGWFFGQEMERARRIMEALTGYS